MGSAESLMSMLPLAFAVKLCVVLRYAVSENEWEGSVQTLFYQFDLNGREEVEGILLNGKRTPARVQLKIRQNHLKIAIDPPLGDTIELRPEGDCWIYKARDGYEPLFQDTRVFVGE